MTDSSCIQTKTEPNNRTEFYHQEACQASKRSINVYTSILFVQEAPRIVSEKVVKLFITI